MLPPGKAKTRGHLPQSLMRAVHRFYTLGGHMKKALRPTAALRRGVATARSNVPLCLEPVKRGIDSSDGHFTMGP